MADELGWGCGGWDKQRVAMQTMLDDMAGASLRCIAFGYRPLQPSEVAQWAEEKDQWVLPDNDLILLAIVGIKVRGYGCLLHIEELDRLHTCFCRMHCDSCTGHLCLENVRPLFLHPSR